MDGITEKRNNEMSKTKDNCAELARCWMKFVESYQEERKGLDHDFLDDMADLLDTMHTAVGTVIEDALTLNGTIVD